MKEINTDENDNIISTASQDFEILGKKSIDNIEEVDQNNVQVILQDIKAEFTNVASILPPSEEILREKDIFDIIKFTIKVKAVHDYEWYVYHKPSDIKTNFEDIVRELENKAIILSDNYAVMFATISSWQDDSLQMHVSEIENFYKQLFQNPNVYNTLSFKEFFNISMASFNQYNEGSKPFEGYVHKKADPHCLRQIFSIACYCIEYFAFAQYNLRWLIVTDNYICYMDNSNLEQGKHIYFFDGGFKARKIDRDIINITNDQRTLILKFKTYFEREIWYSEIMKRANTILNLIKNNPYNAYTYMKPCNTAQWFIDGKDYFEDLAAKLMEAKESILITDWWMSPEVWLNRPVPMNTYMSMAYQKKNVKENDPSRLMDILNACANRGVKIYILLYWENKLASKNDSAHTQNTLTNLHPNIKIARHPDDFYFFWSHHEKLVIIDQFIAYVGGLDLCWGRYDIHEHPIYEPVSKDENNPQYLFPGIDYSNGRIRDFVKVKEYLNESAIRSKEIRMPWHDVHSRIIGPAVIDIARHFFERWNFIFFGTGESITNFKQNSNSKEIKGNDIINNGGMKNMLTNWVGNFLPKNQKKEEEKETIEIKIDLLPKNDKNFKELDEEIINTKDEENKDIINNEIIITNSEEKEDEIKIEDDGNNIDIKEDEPVRLRGRRKKKNRKGKKREVNKELEEKEKKLDELKKSFIENKFFISEDHLFVKIDNNELVKEIKDNDSQNKSTNNNNEINNISNKEDEKEEEKKNLVNINKGVGQTAYNKFISLFIEDHTRNKENSWLSNFIKHKDETNFTNSNNETRLESTIVNVNFYQKGVKSTVQVLRSACDWSVGLKQKENSILQAYIKLIRESKNYIYIENQFFVSRAFDEKELKENPSLRTLVENTIAYEIRKRIEKAYDEGKKFKVIIFIPLLPGFAGDVEKEGTLQLILRYTYEAISRNYGYSIIEKLEEKMGDEWKNYIGFYSLRGHGLMNDVPVTELIYIHSKLMIVDDKYVIIGSANINDRSMLGNRDSEFCVLIHEKENYKSILNGKKLFVAKFAQSFRINLLAEHMGLDPNDDILIDPLNDDFWKRLNDYANNNTIIFRKLFKCYPDDEFKTYNDIRNAVKPKDEELKKLYEKEKGNIKGHVVEFPLYFLESEALSTAFFSKENLVGEKCYS